MNASDNSAANLFKPIDLATVLMIVGVIVAAWIAVVLIEWALPSLARVLPGRMRRIILPSIPQFRLMVVLVALLAVVPLVIEPTTANVVVIVATAGLALGFAFKDYISSLIAGVVAIYERPYRPGDWVRIDDAYGEVRTVGLRSLKLVTPDDTVVTVPHLHLWDSNIFNENDGARSLQCVTNFYLDPDHDASAVRRKLHDLAYASPFLAVDRPVVVIVAEQPWYTHYRLKAYPIDARDQFQFKSDLTVRGKAALSRMGVRPARPPLLERESRPGDS